MGKDRIKKLKNQAELRKITAQAREYFATKSFAERFALLKIVCSYGLIPLSALSALNAIGFFTAYAAPTVGLVGSILVSLLITGLIEVSKTGLFLLSVKDFYKNGVHLLSGLFFVGFVGMLALSVFTSILGAKQLAQDFDQSQTRQVHQTDSLRTHHKEAFGKKQEEATKQRDKRLAEIKADYAKRIASQEQGLAEYNASVSHKGQVNIYNPTNASTIAAYQERISQLQASLIKEIEYVKNEHAKQERALQKKEGETLRTVSDKHQTATQQNDKNMKFSIWFWGLVSGANEVAILFCAWFIIHYYYMVQQEPQDLGINQEESLLKTFERFLFMFAQGNEQDLPSLATQEIPRKTIGFARHEASLATRPDARHEASKSKQDLQGLYNAIARNEGHIPTLMRTYRANIGHIDACKVLQDKPVNDADKVKNTAEYKKVKNTLGL